MALRTIILKVPTNVVGNVLDAVERITGVQIELPLTTTVHREGKTRAGGTCDLVMELLAHQPAKPPQLAAALGVGVNTVYSAINKLKTAGRVRKDNDGRWVVIKNPPLKPMKKATKKAVRK